MKRMLEENLITGGKMCDNKVCTRCKNEKPATTDYFKMILSRSMRWYPFRWCLSCQEQAKKEIYLRSKNHLKNVYSQLTHEERSALYHKKKEYLTEYHKKPEVRKRRSIANKTIHKQKRLTKSKRYRTNNPEKVNLWSKKTTDKMIATAKDPYMRQLLINQLDIARDLILPQELLEAKRSAILLRREVHQILNEKGTKICPKCKQEKPLNNDNFQFIKTYKSSKQNGRYGPYCKSCLKLIKQQTYQQILNDPIKAEQLRDHNRNYYHKHKSTHIKSYATKNRISSRQGVTS